MSRFSLLPTAITGWCERLARAIDHRQGRQVARCLNIDRVVTLITPKEFAAVRLSSFEAYCASYNGFHNPSLKVLVISLFKLMQEKSKATPNLSAGVTHAIASVKLWALHPYDFVRPFSLCYSAYIDIYRSTEPGLSSNWIVPGLMTLLGVLDKTAIEADAQQDPNASMLDDADDSGAGGEERFGSGALRQTENQQKALNTIRQHIGKFRGDESRQAGYVVLMSESIQMCMTLGNLQMASAFLKTVESSYLDLSRIPRAPLVCFKYFLGKLYMQQEKFQKAEEALAWSFTHCREEKNGLKRRIVECLTAVRLRMGKLPPKALLRHYELPHYLKVVSSMKSGDIRKFEKALTEHTNTFIQEGTLLCIERLKFIVYRTLFRRIYEWAKDNIYDGKQVNVVPLGLFSAGFSWQMEDDCNIVFDDEEMACIMANLIRLGYVKGYIAWEYGKIVLSKQTPLPRLRSVQIA